MAKSVKGLREDILYCALCKGHYNKPKTLPCLHSFCLECLDRLASNYQTQQTQPLSCPTCGCIVDLQNGGMEDLPSDHFLISFMERLEEASRLSKQRKGCNCDICRNNGGVMFCLDCKMHICYGCIDTHARLTRSRDHVLMPARALSDQTLMTMVMLTQAPYCNKHKQERVIYICTQCDQLACNVCAIVCHKGHISLQDAKTRIKLIKRNLQIILDQSKIEISSILVKSKETTVCAEEIKSKISAILSDVDTRYDEIVNKLQSDREQLRKELHEIESRKIDYLKSINVDISLWIKKLTNNMESIQRILQENNPWEMLQNERNVNWSFKKLQSDKVCLQMLPLPGKVAFTFIARDLETVSTFSTM